MKRNDEEMIEMEEDSEILPYGECKLIDAAITVWLNKRGLTETFQCKFGKLSRDNEAPPVRQKGWRSARRTVTRRMDRASA